MRFPQSKEYFHCSQRALGHTVVEQPLDQPCFLCGVEMLVYESFDVFYYLQLITLQKIEEFSRIQIKVRILHFLVIRK